MIVKRLNLEVDSEEMIKTKEGKEYLRLDTNKTCI